MRNDQQVIYIDYGDRLELMDSVSLTRMICEEHLGYKVKRNPQAAQPALRKGLKV